jgi:hypothetical protein
MGRNNFRVVSIEKHSLNLTDNTSWQGELNIVRCTRHGVEKAEVGDQVSAEINPINPAIVNDPFLEAGAKAIELRPAPFVAPRVAPFDPTAGVNDRPFVAPDGSSLSAADIDEALRDQAKLSHELTARVATLEAFAPRHCSVCKSHLVESSFR